ncbi:MAG: 16S rRNA (guanine(527)-N(7))-methyltransferase RsmG [Flavobacteriales bacterium]|nr:16S rRNA (guanine(527)-N(7))-methyltransferase RsmG [Flavobacteriales bacterium]MDW8433156.1 16S rRNA (guanine(527)-N(7))-methyltransferase RsmG [Flavobacteriales bacterium]
MDGFWEKHWPDWPEERIHQIEKYASLLKNYNQRINLVSRKDVDNLEEKHILWSLSIARAGLLRSVASLADIGTGGGLPGLPLAIAAPHVQVTLVDSIEKKIRVLQEIIKELNLTHVRAIRSRAEQIEGAFDLITGRAVCPLPEFVKTIRHLIKPGGRIAYLTGSPDPAERRIPGWKVEEIPVRDIFPKSQALSEKFILVANPVTPPV